MPEWASGDYITKNPVFGIGSKKTLERRRTDMAKDPAVDFDGICHKHGASWYYNTSKLLAYLGGVEERKKAEQKLAPRLQQLEEMGL